MIGDAGLNPIGPASGLTLCSSSPSPCNPHAHADTPGVHLHHRIPHMLSPAELKLLHPRRRLALTLPPLPVELAEEEALQAAGLRGGGAAAHGEDGQEDGAGGKAAGAGAAWGAAGLAGEEGDEGVRKGRGGLKIVDYNPTDEYGMPITGLDAGVRQKRGGGGSAKGVAAAGASGGRSGAAAGQGQGQTLQVLDRGQVRCRGGRGLRG